RAVGLVKKAIAARQPLPRRELPDGFELENGEGQVLARGSDAARYAQVADLMAVLLARRRPGRCGMWTGAGGGAARARVASMPRATRRWPISWPCCWPEDAPDGAGCGRARVAGPPAPVFLRVDAARVRRAGSPGRNPRRVQAGACRSSSRALRKRAASPPVQARWSKVSEIGITLCASKPPTTGRISKRALPAATMATHGGTTTGVA